MSSNDIYHAAVTYLSIREYGHMELRDKLLKKDFDENQVNDVLQQLIDKGLLSEQRYVDSYIHSYAVRGVGPIKIRMQLSQKHVADKDIQAGFERSEEDWQAHLLQVWRKKYGGKHPVDAREHQRQTRFLMHRGFTHDGIVALLAGKISDDY